MAFSLLLIYAACPKFLLLGCLAYAPCSLLYLQSRREQGQSLRQVDLFAAGLLSLLAAVEVALLLTGAIRV